MKDLLEFSIEKKPKPRLSPLSNLVKAKCFVQGMFELPWSCSRFFLTFFSPSKPAAAVLDVSQDEPGSLMATCFPPALSKGGKLVLQRRVWHFERVKLLQLSFVITKYCHNLIIFIITSSASQILFCFLPYKDTDIRGHEMTDLVDPRKWSHSLCVEG